MISIRKVLIVTTLLTLYSMNAFGSDTGGQKSRGKHQGPPPEVYTACENKTAGDVAQFTSPRGDTIPGTCEQEGDRLVLRPTNRPSPSKGNAGGRHHDGPPPEAYTACENKNSGDTAEFVSPRGDTITGTCEQKDDRLVLRPDRSRNKS